MKERFRAQPIQVVRLDGSSPAAEEADEVTVEEPLEIQVEGQSIAVVMRTPGNDRELAAGFALTEGIVHARNEVFEITSCLTNEQSTKNIINVALRDPGRFDRTKFSRNVFTSSSCGVCGKATIEAVQQQFPAISCAPAVGVEVLRALPARLIEAQETFQRTGGLHACALFDLQGQLLLLREDVGRHNALDKLIGHELLANQLPLADRVLLLSGRVSFEMTQKALAAGIGIIAAISAPSSLAVEFARANNQTLIGFLRGQRMNIYAGAERVTR